MLREPLFALPYPGRLERLLAHRVGVWDVLDACDRDGSLDSSITNPRANQFVRLRRIAPRLVDVAFNGQAAGRFAAAFREAGYSTTVLPSSSPAHAGRTYGQKLELWQAWWEDRPAR